MIGNGRYISSDELLITGKLLGLPKSRCGHRKGMFGIDYCDFEDKPCLEETDPSPQCCIHIEEELDLEVVLMPNGEVICLGKTVGWFHDLSRFLTPKEVKGVQTN